MRYVSWAALYEGSSDALYFDVLIPRMLRDMIACEGNTLADVPDNAVVRLGHRSRQVETVAQEICHYREAFDLVFIHADTGGRDVERGNGSLVLGGAKEREARARAALHRRSRSDCRSPP